MLAVGAALWTGLTLKLDLFQHPKLIANDVSDARPSAGPAFDLWEELRRKAALPNLSIQVELQHAKQQVWMRLEGRLSRAEAEGLGQRIRDSLARSKSRLVLDLKKLQWDKVDDLRPLQRKAGRLPLAHPADPAQTGSGASRGDPAGQHVSPLQGLKDQVMVRPKRPGSSRSDQWARNHQPSDRLIA